MSELTPQLKQLYQEADPYDLDIFLRDACGDGELEKIQYLLTSPEIKRHPDLCVRDGRSLRYAGSNGQLEVIKYLVASPDLKEHADIHVANDNVFMISCEKRYNDVLGYLIFEYQIKQTEDIQKYLKKNKNKKVMNMFKLRELNKKLNIDLEDKPPANKKIKI